ncbi:hypothetical protein FRC02_005012 [Tulasnella sp. 418]|nr:hypothetical protein FRC02_005012 [Tulasnella sp. 418]
MEQNNASCWTNLKDSINWLERDLAKVAVDVAGVNNRFDELSDRGIQLEARLTNKIDSILQMLQASLNNADMAQANLMHTT